MTSLPTKGNRQDQPFSPIRQARTRSVKGSSVHRVNRPPASPDAAKRTNLCKSVTGFFCKLRPSKRPERGGTARPTTHSDGENSPGKPTPPAGCRKKRSSSLGSHGPDTIPANCWNMAITPPRRVHSVGSRARRKPVGTQPSTSKMVTATTNPPATKPIPASHKKRGPPQSHNHIVHVPTPLAPLPPPQQPFQHHPPTLQPQTPPRSAQPTSAPVPTPTAHTRDLYLANRARRHSRRTLLSSGDFLGVTGANPYTGEPDIITPPTSTSSVIPSSSTASSFWPTSSALATAANALARGKHHGGSGELVHWDRERIEKGLRRIAKEEERLCRAEQRKDEVREVLMQGGGVKWRREEGGWSSVAEPKLSPIMQSPQGSGKSSRSWGEKGVMQEGKPFLEMAAAARGLGGCRRRYSNLEGVTGMVLVQQRRGQMVLERVDGQGMVGGLAALGKVMVRFCLPPVVPRRESSHQCATSCGLDPYPEWELGNLIAIPVDLRRLSQDWRARQITTGRVLELDDLDPAEPWTDKRPHGLRRPASPPGRMLQASSAEGGRGLSQAHASVCTRTTTTTGFEHSPPQPHAAGQLFDGIIDGLREARLIRRAWTPQARSRPTSTRSSTRTSSSACSDLLASPSSMQLSIWQSLSNLGLPTARTTALVRKKAGIGPPEQNRIPLQRLKPGPDSDTTSSSTDQEPAALGREKDSPAPAHHMDGAAEDPPQARPDWAMRKTMRKPCELSPSHPKTEETGTTRRSSPPYTRTSTSPLTQPQPSRATTSARRPAEAVTIARGAARTAFTHTTDYGRALPMTTISGLRTTTPMRVTVIRPASAPQPSRGYPHGVPGTAAAGTKAKTAAKPASAAGTGPGQGQQGKGGNKGKGKGPDEDQEKTESQDKGEKKESKEKGKENQQNKGKKKEAMTGSPEFEQWMRNATMMLARVVGAYWQVVSPVFDGDSELRRRIDKAQATRGDGVMCILAVVFLFLVVSVGVWAVRGIIWVVALLGEIGEVLKAVAGL